MVSIGSERMEKVVTYCRPYLPPFSRGIWLYRFKIEYTSFGAWTKSTLKRSVYPTWLSSVSNSNSTGAKPTSSCKNKREYIYSVLSNLPTENILYVPIYMKGRKLFSTSLFTPSSISEMYRLKDCLTIWKPLSSDFDPCTTVFLPPRGFCLAHDGLLSLVAFLPRAAGFTPSPRILSQGLSRQRDAGSLVLRHSDEFLHYYPVLWLLTIHHFGLTLQSYPRITTIVKTMRSPWVTSSAFPRTQPSFLSEPLVVLTIPFFAGLSCSASQHGWYAACLGVRL